MIVVKYFQEAVRNYAVHLMTNCSGRFRLPKKAEDPLKMGYDQELDISQSWKWTQYLII